MSQLTLSCLAVSCRVQQTTRCTNGQSTPIDIANITVAAAQAKKLEAEAKNLDQSTKEKEQQTLKLAEEIAEVKANVARIEGETALQGWAQRQLMTISDSELKSYSEGAGWNKGWSEGSSHDIRGQQEGFPTKPNPAIVEEILKLAKVEKSKILYVGDSAIDVATAYNAKIAFTGVLWGFRPQKEMEEIGATSFAKTTEELYKIIKR